MKAAIYNPYLDTLGGGERYTMSLVRVLSEMGYEVDVEWKEESIKESLQTRFGIDLKDINFVKSINKGEGYDVCFWVSDGSIPLLHSRKNLLHFQVPFQNVQGRTLINKMKLIRVSKIICNSHFTKKVIDREFGVNSTVIYPPVDTERLTPSTKKNKILYVGRFSQLKQDKRQDVLISVFKKMVKAGLKNWKLILAGGSEVGLGDNLNKLYKMAEGYQIEFEISPSYKKLLSLYAEAKIFWSAAGYGVDEVKNPEKVEHFGITLVEAMSAGCIPVVFKAGGHKEIIDDGLNGFMWTKTSELVSISKNIIRKGNSKVSVNARQKSNQYSYSEFKESLKDIF